MLVVGTTVYSIGANWLGSSLRLGLQGRRSAKSQESDEGEARRLLLTLWRRTIDAQLRCRPSCRRSSAMASERQRVTAQGYDADGGVPNAPADAGTSIERAIADFAINGVARLDDVIPLEAVAQMRAAWSGVHGAFNSRFGPAHMPSTADGSYSGKGPHRHQIVPLPLAPPFLAAATATPDEQLSCFVEHPAVIAFMTGVLGPGYQCSGWGCNSNSPGSAYQRWHRDGSSGPQRWLSAHWVLEDSQTSDQGLLEYIPCTQHVPDFFTGLDGTAVSRPLTASLDRLLSAPGGTRGSGPMGALGAWGQEWEDGHKGPHRLDGLTLPSINAVPMRISPGQLWFRDNMVYHRGSPNRSTARRDLFHLYFHSASEHPITSHSRGRTLGWAGKPTAHASQFIPAQVFAQLSSDAKHVFRAFRVATAEIVAAEQEAAGAWPEEDAMILARL